MLEMIAASLILATGGYWWLRRNRVRHYDRLASLWSNAAGQSSGLELRVPEQADFSRRLALIDKALEPGAFDALAAEIEALTKTERSFVPSHKKGGTIAYETLCAKAPGVVALYQSPDLHRLISRVVGTDVVPTPLHDQSSCSVLFYEQPGDHIGWHYDHNFYRGRHFTALVPIVNRGREPGELSSAQLMAKLDGREEVIDTMPNSLVVFEGACVVHKVTPIRDGERRIILSMTFTENPTNTWLQGAARRIKDTAFFGVRALWT